MKDERKRFILTFDLRLVTFTGSTLKMEIAMTENLTTVEQILERKSHRCHS